MQLTEHQQKRLCKTVLNTAIQVLEGNPFFPVAAEIEQNFGRLSIVLFVDKKDVRINLDECAKVSQLVDPAMTELAELQALNYTLDVSSPGLFRQLQTPRELMFYVGKTVTIKPVDVVISKETDATLARYQLNQHTVDSTTVLLLDEAGNTKTLDVSTLPKSEGLYLAPPIQWPNSNQEDDDAFAQDHDDEGDAL